MDGGNKVTYIYKNSLSCKHHISTLPEKIYIQATYILYIYVFVHIYSAIYFKGYRLIGNYFELRKVCTMALTIFKSFCNSIYLLKRPQE